MEPWQQHFLVGAVGAIAPEVVRLRNVIRDKGTYTWSPALFGISLAYALIAGLIAAILPSANLYAAFYCGVSTDVLIGKVHAEAANTRQERARNAQNKAPGDTGPPPRLSPLHSFLDAL